MDDILRKIYSGQATPEESIIMDKTVVQDGISTMDKIHKMIMEMLKEKYGTEEANKLKMNILVQAVMLSMKKFITVFCKDFIWRVIS